MDVNSAIIERLERVVESLQDNSIKMGQLLAVHQAKLEQQEKVDDILFAKIDHLHKDLHEKTDEIKKGCERDILLVDTRIRTLERKLWSIAGGLAVITVLLSNAGSSVFRNLTTAAARATILPVTRTVNELPGQ
jgi:hypothetical protein